MENYQSKFTGPQIDAALEKASGINPDANGFIKLKSTEAEPVNLNVLTGLGNFTTMYHINGHVDFLNIRPINISIMLLNGVVKQVVTVVNHVYIRAFVSGAAWTSWLETATTSTIYQQAQAPTDLSVGVLWIDTTYTDKFALYVSNGVNYVPVKPSNMMEIDVYDPNGLKVNFYQYVDNAVAQSIIDHDTVSIYTIMETHTNDVVKHVTAAERSIWTAKETPAGAQAKVDASLVAGKAHTDTKAATLNGEISTVNSKVVATDSKIDTHIADTTKHVSGSERTDWNSKASGTHSHLSDGKVEIDASDVISGILDIARIPQAALERVAQVDNDVLRFALTTTTVQNGDMVAVKNLPYLKTAPISANWQSITFGNGLFVAITSNAAIAMTSSDGNTWTQRTLPVSANWQSITFGNGLFVAVSYSNDKIITSSDGITWTQRTVPVNSTWQSITYGNGLFVAIANTSTISMTSPDGITWTQRALPVSGNWKCVTYGNGLFVAIAGNTTNILTSPDSITWTQRVLPVSDNWKCITYGNGLFVAIANTSANIVTSTDGITWTQRAVPVSSSWYSITYGNGLFVAIANASTIIITSTDGITWTQRAVSLSISWTSIAYGNGLFIAISSGSTNISILNNKIGNTSLYIVMDDTKLNIVAGYIEYASGIADSVNWGNVTSKPTSILGYGIKDAYTKTEVDSIISTTKSDASTEMNTKIAALTIPATKTNLANHTANMTPHITAAERTDWNSKAAAVHSHLSDGKVQIDASKIVSGTIPLARIPQGAIEKTKRVHNDAERFALTTAVVQNGDTVAVGGVVDNITTPLSASWRSIAYGNGLFVAISSGGLGIITSTDGTTWTQRNATVSTTWISVAYGNGLFVAISANTTISMTSPDGITWTQRVLPLNSDWYRIIYANAMFVAIAHNSNKVITSTDGITWTQRTLPVSVDWRGITYGNGVFVMVSYTSTIIVTSPDGITWTQRALPISTGWVNITFGNGLFVVISTNTTTIATSPDGIIWTQRALPISAQWVDITFGNGLFVAIASGSSKIITSFDGILWAQRVLPLTASWTSVMYGNSIFVAVANNTASIIRFDMTVAELPNIYVIIDDTKLNLADGYLEYSVGTAERIMWSNIINKPCTVSSYGITDVYTKNEVNALNTAAINEGKAYADQKYTDISPSITALQTAETTHIGNAAIHLTQTQIDSWNSKAAGNHTHTAGDGTITISASQITSGVFDIARIPQGALERLVTVDSDMDRFSLTTTSVQNGDTVVVKNLPGQRIAPANTSWGVSAYGNGLFVVLAGNTTISMTSTNGVAWTQRVLPVSAVWSALIYANGLFVAIGQGSTKIITSPDGITWTQRTAPVSTTWTSITYGNGLFVIVATASNVTITSPDGITWTQRALPVTLDSRVVLYSNGLFIILGWNTAVYLTSTDGITWTQRALPIIGNWYTLTYGNGLFVTISQNTAAILTSPDGITWTQRTAPLSGAWYSLNYGNGLFVTGNSGTTAYMTSKDGVTWVTQTAPVTANWNNIIYGNGSFITVTPSSTKILVINSKLGTTSIYVVTDDTKLISELGYTEYGAGIAIDSVYWANILNKPNSIAGFGITDAYTKTEVTGLISTAKNSAENYISTAITELDFTTTDAQITAQDAVLAAHDAKMDLVNANATVMQDAYTLAVANYEQLSNLNVSITLCNTLVTSINSLVS